jgi:Arc/MetJ-type ribon-helix-helix transcriptional regulator
MKQISIAVRIPHGWHSDLQSLVQTTGKSQSDLVKEALGLYLKRSAPAKKLARLDAVEESIASLRELVLQVASEVFETPSV